MIYMNVKSLARIAAMLRIQAIDNGEIQQSLNSIFTERATQKLGDYRKSHATVWALMLVVLTLASPLFLVSSHASLRMNTTIAINASGGITPLPYVSLSGRTHSEHLPKELKIIFLVLFLANTSLGLLMWLSVVRQLKPRDIVDK